MTSSLEIAQQAQLRPIEEMAADIGLEPEEVEPYGRYKATIALSAVDRLRGAPDAKIVCVSRMTPTRTGEGKTTTAVSLTHGLGFIGQRPVLCLREPSLGPVFGIKGGAAGGGWRRWSPWRTSTCTSQATSMRSRRRTTCSLRCSTPRSCTAIRMGSTHCRGPGSARWT